MNAVQSNSIPNYGTIGENVYMLDLDYVGHLCAFIVSLYFYSCTMLRIFLELKFELNNHILTGDPPTLMSTGVVRVEALHVV